MEAKKGLGSCQLRVDGTCFGTNLIQFEVSLNWMKSWIDTLAKTKLIPNTVISYTGYFHSLLIFHKIIRQSLPLEGSRAETFVIQNYPK